MIKKTIVDALRNGKVVDLELAGDNTLIQATIKVPEIGMVEQKVLEDLKLLLCNKTKQGLTFNDNRVNFITLSDAYFESNLSEEKTFVPENIQEIKKFFNTLIISFSVQTFSKKLEDESKLEIDNIPNSPKTIDEFQD